MQSDRDLGSGDVMYLRRQVAICTMEVCWSLLMDRASGWDSSPLERGRGADSPRGTEVLNEFQGLRAMRQM